MKIKHVVITLVLSLTLGLGTLVGLKASAKETKSAKAIGAGDTIYLKANATWHGTVNADYSLWMHCWNTESDATNVEFTYVTDTIYSATLPSACSNIIFFRSQSGTPINWYDQSADLVLANILDGGNNVVIQNDSGYTFSNLGKGEYRPDKTAGTAYLRGSWSWSTFDYQLQNTATNTYSIENVPLTAGSEIKIMTIGNDKWVTYHDASDLQGNSDAQFVSPNVTIQTTGKYNITFYSDTKVYKVDEYEDTDLTAAVAFANDFETSMAKYCPITGTDEGKGTAKLASEWADFEERFSGVSSTLTVQTRTYLKTLNDGSTIQDFRERYDSILSDYYSLLSGHNFLERNVQYTNAPTITIGNNDNTVSIIIVVVSSISLIALGGFFFIKKRKEN